MKNVTVKKCLRLLLFFLILLAMLAVLSLLFRPKGNAASDGMYDTNPNGILAEPADTVDVLFLGDSEADCAFIPHKIWTDYGISTYVCGVGGQHPYQSVGFLKQAFETQNPKVVILEANHLYQSYTRTEGLMYELEQLLPVFRYHNRWKSLQLRDWYAPVVYDSPEYQKGYHFDNTIKPADTSHYMEYTDDARPIASACAADLREIRDICRERGAELIVVSVPSALNWSYDKHNGVAALTEELGLPYVDMNLLREEIPVDWELETQDNGDHVNYSGALKVSAYVGKWMWETGLFRDRRGGPEDAGWNWAIARFNEVNNLPEDSLKG